MNHTQENSYRYRLEVAQTLAAACPSTLAQEIIITDAPASNAIEKFLPIKMRFYADKVDSVAPIEVWLRSTGIVVDPMSSMWRSGVEIRGRANNSVFVETGWYTFNTLHENLTPILAGQVLDHWLLVDAWRIDTAISLTPTPRITEWQARLHNYPTRLQENLIISAMQLWTEPLWYPNSLVILHAMREKNAIVALTQWLHRHVEGVLRIVFAFNKCWEPDFRWLASELPGLEHRPADFTQRIHHILSIQNVDESVDTLFALIIDTLQMISSDYDVSKALGHVREARAVDSLDSLM